MKKVVYLLISILVASSALLAQQKDRRSMGKKEIQFLHHKVDSVKKNLNRMIRYERELLQRNYYLNEKTALVDELTATVRYLQTAVDVVQISRSDVKKIFGNTKANFKERMIYEIETYRSNCPFMEIEFLIKGEWVQQVNYRITDCQKWK